MKIKDSIIACSTLHEVEFKLKPVIESSMAFLKKQIPSTVISCTQNTDNEVIRYLEEQDFYVSIPNENNRIATYRDAVLNAIDLVDSPKTQRIFYIDFDRLIHWINEYPQELIDSVQKAKDTDLLHIGRTQEAFQSHPETQKNTERIVNNLGSQCLGFRTTRDLISVCFAFTTSLADLILSKKYHTEMGFYCAFPVILWSYAEKKQYIEVNGLEWETPDRFQYEIKEIGYKTWLQEFQSAQEWKKRITLAEDCIIEMSTLFNFRSLSQ